MSDGISNVFQSLRKCIHLIFAAKSSYLIVIMNEIFRHLSAADPDEVSSLRAFFYTLDFEWLRHKQIEEEYINIICDFRLSVSGEKSYHVCRFRSLLSLVSYRRLCFLFFLHSFFLSSNVRELFSPKIQRMPLRLMINTSNRSFSFFSLVCFGFWTISKGSGDERKDQDATRIKNKEKR